MKSQECDAWTTVHVATLFHLLLLETFFMNTHPLLGSRAQKAQEALWLEALRSCQLPCCPQPLDKG